MLEITSGALARLPLLYSETLCSTIEPQHSHGLATQAATWKELREVIPIGSLDGAQNTLGQNPFASSSRLLAERRLIVIRAICHRAAELPSRPDRSKTEKRTHLSSACRLDTESLRPRRTLFERSNPAAAEEEFGLHDPSIPRTRHASGPRTDALGRPGFGRACCHSAV